MAASSPSALSPFRFYLLTQSVALLPGCRRGLLSGNPPWEQPVLGLGLLLLRLRLPGAVGQGAGQPTGGYVPLFMTGSDPERVNFTNPAQSRRVKINIY
jgi:hypothetical protein